MSDLKISLVIPAYNEEKYIGSCLEHALTNGHNAFHEIIVIDNCSNDKTKQIAEAYNVRVVREEHKGLTRARQRGFEEASGDIIAFIDADTRMPEGWVSTLTMSFVNNNNLACLSGPYVYYDISPFQQWLVKIYWYILAMPAYWIIGYMTVGGNFAIRKTTLAQMNGFDTSIEFYGEDTNIARRAHMFGKVTFNPRFIMYTSGRRLAGQGLLKTSFLYATNFLSEVLFQKPSTKKYKDIR